eukprot:TRINITY_DN3512_c0_g1_i2.p1 TRINITY_DN3512_c0_g1~~TRINITY_DN3512_c0_g1_i2.p1  ORF type:complete len:1140 (-),score=254.19 TRINITY_DN3512_c0_g1_i2:51-3470(-)
MSDPRTIVDSWIRTHPHVFQLVSVDPATYTVQLSLAPDAIPFTLLCDDSWHPFMAASEAPQLEPWIERVNMILQVNSSPLMVDLLTHAQQALGDLAPPTPTPTPAAPPSTTNDENMNNAQPPVISTQIPSNTPLNNPSDTDADMVHASNAPTTNVNAPANPLNAHAGLNSLRASVQQWQRDYPTTELTLVNLQENDFMASLSIKIADQVCPFQVIFDENWRPMLISSEHASLETLITHANLVLEDRSQQLSISDLFLMFGAAFAAEFVPRAPHHPYGMDEGEEDTEDKVQATEADWENIIMPAVRVHLIQEDHMQFEIDEWERRIRAYLRKKDYPRALSFVSHDIFASSVPRTISRFFPRDIPRRWGLSNFGRENGLGEALNTEGGSEEAATLLMDQLAHLRTLSEAGAPFKVEPINNDLFLWNITLYGFGKPPAKPTSSSTASADTMDTSGPAEDATTETLSSPKPAPSPPAPTNNNNNNNNNNTSASTVSNTETDDSERLESQLRDYYVRLAESIRGKPMLVSPLGFGPRGWRGRERERERGTWGHEVVVEALFPPGFPEEPPLFRVIRPRFKALDLDAIFGRGHTKRHPSTPKKLRTSQSGLSDSSSELKTLPTLDGSMRKSSDHLVDKPPGSPSSRPSLAVSRVLETQIGRSGWNPSSVRLDDIIMGIRTQLIRRGEVDLDTASEAYLLPTVGGFWKVYNALSVDLGASDTKQRENLEYGGKLILPASAIEELSQYDWGDTTYGHSPQVSQPMCFEVSSAHETRRTFCGVFEFTADEGTVVMPPWVLRALQVQPGEAVQVRRVLLPKATSLRLQPHSDDFFKQGNPKGLLEWVLPHFVALSPGDIITVSFYGTQYVLEVLEVAPGRAVCMTDSDVTVDFAPAVNASSSSSSPTPATPPPKQIDSPSSTTTAGTVNTAEGQEGVDYKMCDNCRHPVPMARYAIHSAQCARINQLCSRCGVVVQRTKLAEHEAEVHAEAPCPKGCGAQVERQHMDRHVALDCPLRIVRCIWCDLEITAAARQEHESRCGDLTDECEHCHQRVQRRALLTHPSMCPALNAGAGQGPTPSEPYRGAMSPGRRDDSMFQCETCRAWLPAFDELQVHMLTQHADLTPTETPATATDTPAPPTNTTDMDADN